MTIQKRKNKEWEWDWDKKSSVRSNPETYDLYLNKDSNEDNLRSWSSSDYTPILDHEAFSGMNELDRKFVMGIQLLEFVIKTTKFEIDYVNNVAANLGLDKYPHKISRTLQLDAMKIYTDEGYHAYFSQKIADQIREYYDVKDDVTKYIDLFFLKLENLLNEVEEKYKYLIMIAIVVVGENQIVLEISEEMKQIQYEPIRLMFKNHIADESFHAKYFSKIFKVIWKQLSLEEKEIMGYGLSNAMTVLGTPRTDIHFYSFKKLGFKEDLLRNCINNVYQDPLKIKIKNKMSPILNLLRSTDLFEIPTVRKSFEIQGYI